MLLSVHLKIKKNILSINLHGEKKNQFNQYSVICLLIIFIPLLPSQQTLPSEGKNNNSFSLPSRIMGVKERRCDFMITASCVLFRILTIMFKKCSVTTWKPWHGEQIVGGRLWGGLRRKYIKRNQKVFLLM